MKKRIISVLLVTMLMVGVLGSSVFAASFSVQNWKDDSNRVHWLVNGLTSSESFIIEVYVNDGSLYAKESFSGTIGELWTSDALQVGVCTWSIEGFDSSGESLGIVSGTILVGDTASAQANIAGRGTVSPSSVTGATGESASFLASPAAGHFFKKWVDASGQTVGTDETLTVTINGNTTYTAVFDTNPDTSDPYAPAEGTEPVEDDPIPAAIPNHIVQDLAEISPTATLYSDDDVLEDDTVDQPVVADEVPSMEEGDEDLDPMDQVAAEEEVVEEDVVDQDVPADVPAMPQTAGIPLALLALSGSAISAFGLKIRKRK